MEVDRVLYMNKGSGEYSYAKNSTVQRKIISIGRPVVEKAIDEILNKNVPKSFGIADLGCSSGPNSLLVVSEIIHAVHVKCLSLGYKSPEFSLLLNDLFNNDFNDIFRELPDFYTQIKAENGPEFGPCFVSGVPGSFYGRLFPKNSLHFVHSSSSLHWLSKVPRGLESDAKVALNKGNVCVSKSSPKRVLEAYSEQFAEDFGLFLRSRSHEVVAGGRMVLSFMGRTSSDPTFQHCCRQFELLALALMAMVSDGLIKEEKVDSFNVPYYTPSPEEVRKEIENEGSFRVEVLEAFRVAWDESGDSNGIEECELSTNSSLVENCYEARGHQVAKSIRAVVESMLESHFGSHILDDLFSGYQRLVTDYISKSSAFYIYLVVSLVKLQPN